MAGFSLASYVENIVVASAGTLTINGSMNYSAPTIGTGAGQNTMTVSNGSSLTFYSGTQTYTGSMVNLFTASTGGTIVLGSSTLFGVVPVTFAASGSPSFASGGGFANASNLGAVYVVPACITFTGSATGPRYAAAGNAVIFTQGSGANYFPGNSSGSTSSGAQYI
jgi:hypothetical protein